MLTIDSIYSHLTTYLIRRLAIILPMFFFILHILAPTTKALEDENWMAVLRMYNESIVHGMASIKEMESEITKTGLGSYRKKLITLEKERGQLLIWAGSSNPWDNRNALMGISLIRESAERASAPFQKQLKMTDGYIADGKELLAEMTRMMGDVTSNREKELLAQNIQNNNLLLKELEHLKIVLDGEIDLANQLIARLDKTTLELKARTGEIWKTFLLNPPPHLASSELWENFFKNRQWESAITTDYFKLITSEATAKNFISILKKAGLLWFFSSFIVVAASMLLLRGKLSRPSIMKLCTVWIVSSPGIFMNLFRADFPFLLLSHINDTIPFFFYTGLFVLAWFIVTISNQSENFQYAMIFLSALLALITIVILLRSAGLPYTIGVSAYTTILLFTGIYFLRYPRTQNNENRSKSPLYISIFFFGMAVASFSGFSIAASLLITALFCILNITVVSIAIYRLSLTADDSVTKDSPTLTSSLLRGIILPVFTICFVLLNIWLFSYKTGIERLFWDLLSYQMTIGAVEINARRIIITLVAFFVVKSTVSLLDFLIEHRRGLTCDSSPDTTETVKTLAGYLIWSLYGITVLAYMHFSLKTIVVVLGGLSVGLGFGLQHIVNNFFSGMILLFGKDIRPSDIIQLGAVRARVRKVTITNTVVQTNDNATIFIPNSELVSRQLMNWSHSDRSVRLDITVGIAYDSNIELAAALLVRAAQGHPETLPSPPPATLLWNFGADALEYHLRFWISNVDRDFVVMSEVRSGILALFREHGVEIAFPQHDVHIRTAADRLYDAKI